MFMLRQDSGERKEERAMREGCERENRCSFVLKVISIIDGHSIPYLYQ
jgi:hypothetical protein